MVNINTKKVNKPEIIHFTMRMESKLYELLKLSAIKNRRSIAKELEFAAEFYLNATN